MDTRNPVTRLLVACNTTEAKFRERFNFSKQFMVDITAGAASRLPDSIHKALRVLTTEKDVRVADTLWDAYGTAELDRAYERWQHAQRQLHAAEFERVRPNEWSPSLSPAHFFVKHTSGTPTRFSKDLCVPPQMVRRWVSGLNKQMPETIYHALDEIGYPYLRELVEVQAAWLQEHR